MHANPAALAETSSPVFQAHGDGYAFGNAAIALSWSMAERSIDDVSIVDRAHGRSIKVIAPFMIGFADGSELGAKDLHVLAPLREEALPFDVDALRQAGRIPGKRIVVTLGDNAQRLRIEWSVEQRDHALYLRHHLSITALSHDEPITSVSLFQSDAPHAHRAGDLAAVPVIDGNVYLGFELPMSESEVRDDIASFRVKRALPLEKGKTLTYSFVAGVYREGQLRRDFAAYIECERARPYSPLLHYNSWCDIGFLTKYTQEQAIERIHAIGHALHEKRGVQLDAFLFDDGWDDYSGAWTFSPAFPDGFIPLRDAAAGYRAAPGVWLSPWGGYGPPRTERVTRGRATGYETTGDGFALSGPKYYQRFHEVAMDLLTRHGVNHFKLDGTGNANTVVPGSRFNSDWDAAVELIDAMRRVKRDVFVNLSTGTQASPFWLRYVDSVWRDGADYGFAGAGSDREQWITYRDAQTYRNVVCRSPLFPLNSLMLHGIIYAQENKRLNSDPAYSFAHEVQTYFGSGTQLQELYVTPSLLQSRDWDCLAQAARWARSHADVLRDCHWIGGAPDKLEVYGWAAWTPSMAIVTLRNPAEFANDFVLDLQAQLELPDASASMFGVRFPFGEGDSNVPSPLDAFRQQSIRLAPFQVLTMELYPVAR
ncbi:enterotoxin [Paraburkholderia sp. C35]|uniref:enterotoxin n=1 Tax=Paraburkholderia sp. C35 TaxID=2126993 RepID=UPI000D69EF19|nr:enterotoxin [Paraburkholderia sp. C35]